MDSNQRTVEDVLENDSLLEEAYEAVTFPTNIDEILLEMLKLEMRRTRILEAEFGAPGSGLTEVGGQATVPIDEAANFRFMPATPEAIEEVETETAVTVNVGATETVLRHQPSQSLLWYEVGTTDNDDTEYQYEADGVPFYGDPQQAPRAPYPDSKLWPQPVIVRDDLEVRVTRLGSASAPADYVSKAMTVPIGDDTASQLERAWGSL